MTKSGEAIVLDARAHGENHAIVRLLTAEFGSWSGLVHGGQGRRRLPVLQPGNEVVFEWQGRGESLGRFSLELLRARAGEAIHDRLALAGMSSACAVACVALPERQAEPRVFGGMRVLFDHLGDESVWPALMARWELRLLAELGFGLSLERCAATGATAELVYVSPKSGRAVCREAGAPYHDRMLALPGFLIERKDEASREDAIAALLLTGHFIETRVLHPAGQQLPAARQSLIDFLGRYGDTR